MVRDMTLTDVAVVTELARELGYATTEEELRARFELLSKDPAAGLYVAERAGVVIGFIQVGIRVPLEAKIHAEILALSATGKEQRTGAGRALCARAAAFAKHHGLTTLRVRSNIARDGSHAFYTHLGFEKTKTQHVYALPI